LVDIHESTVPSSRQKGIADTREPIDETMKARVNIKDSNPAFLIYDPLFETRRVPVRLLLSPNISYFVSSNPICGEDLCTMIQKGNFLFDNSLSCSMNLSTLLASRYY